MWRSAAASAGWVEVKKPEVQYRTAAIHGQPRQRICWHRIPLGTRKVRVGPKIVEAPGVSRFLGQLPANCSSTSYPARIESPIRVYEHALI